MMRNSGAGDKNDKVVEWPASEYPDNMRFFSDAFAELRKQERHNNGYMAIGFLGQRDMPGVLVRRAQAVLRWDLRPSLWSHVFLVIDPVQEGRDVADVPVREVVLHSRAGVFPEPGYNAVVNGRLTFYAGADVDANVALVSVGMSTEQAEKVGRRAKWDVNLDRLRYNLWEILGAWQSYLWSAGTRNNPLREGVPVFSSAFIEYCFEAIQLDLSPAASERNSAPEHLWNAVTRWHDSLARLGHDVSGYYLVRDPGCAVLDASPPPG